MRRHFMFILVLVLLSACSSRGQLLDLYLVTVDASGNAASKVGGENLVGSLPPDVNSDGRFVVFDTLAALHPDDANGVFDVYIYDRLTKVTQPVSVDSAGNFDGSESSRYPRISGDGRYVVFASCADLGGGHPPGEDHIYIRDVIGMTTTHVAPGDDARISSDGTHVAWRDDTTSPTQVMITNVTGAPPFTPELVSKDPGTGTPGDRSSTIRGLSADGSYVLIGSFASNLAGADPDPYDFPLVVDRTVLPNVITNLGKHENGSLVSGVGGWGLSADGSIALLASGGTRRLVDDPGVIGMVYAVQWQEAPPVVEPAMSYPDGSFSNPGFDRPAINEAGNIIVAEDRGGSGCWARNRITGEVWRIDRGQGDVDPEGSWSPDISGDGEWFTFVSTSRNILLEATTAADHIFLIRR